MYLSFIYSFAAASCGTEETKWVVVEHLVSLLGVDNTNAGTWRVILQGMVGEQESDVWSSLGP